MVLCCVLLLLACGVHTVGVWVLLLSAQAGLWRLKSSQEEGYPPVNRSNQRAPGMCPCPRLGKEVSCFGLPLL